MPPIVALGLFLAFILWLLVDDSRRRPQVTSALWIPFLWMAILGSRFVSVWIGLGATSVGSDGYSDGSPLDRMVFLALIVAGFLVLIRRRVSLGIFIRQNKWLVAYFLYIGVSVIWSDATFVSFKRWIKDVGNIVMVLVILSEPDPGAAIKSLLARFAFIMIPLSVLFNKYYPNLSRYYDQWTYQPFFSGVTTDKNLLGMTLFVSGIFLFWNMYDLRRAYGQRITKQDLFVQGVMFAMTFWLLSKTRSSTALACTVLGGALIIVLRFSVIQRASKRLSMYTAAAILLILGLNSVFNLEEEVVSLLGRDMTLTGRTEIWEAVLQQGTNPLFGTGFYSFWSESRVQVLSAEHYFHLNSAHNAYLETYLNTGLIGVVLLLGTFISSFFRIGDDVRDGSPYGAFRLAVLVSVAAYGMTEAIFNRLGPIWVLLLLVIVEYKQQGNFTADPRATRFYSRKPESSPPLSRRHPVA